MGLCMIGLEHVMTHPPDVMAQAAPRARFSAIHEASLMGGQLPPRAARHDTHTFACVCVVGVGGNDV